MWRCQLLLPQRLTLSYKGIFRLLLSGRQSEQLHPIRPGDLSGGELLHELYPISLPRGVLQLRGGVGAIHLH